MKYGNRQGSVLGPTLFSLFCNDFPDIAELEGVLQMYVDDTAIYTTAPLLDKAQTSLTLSWKSYMNGAAGTNFPPISGDPMLSIVVFLYSSSPRYGSRLSCFALLWLADFSLFAMIFQQAHLLEGEVDW